MKHLLEAIKDLLDPEKWGDVWADVIALLLVMGVSGLLILFIYSQVTGLW